MKALLVARVSIGEQGEVGNSLPAQEKRLREYCARKHFEIIEAYSFDESAYGDKRDEFDQILGRISPPRVLRPFLPRGSVTCGR